MQNVKKVNFVTWSEILVSWPPTGSVTSHKHFCSTSELIQIVIYIQSKEKLLLQKVHSDACVPLEPAVIQKHEFLLSKNLRQQRYL